MIFWDFFHLKREKDSLQWCDYDIYRCSICMRYDAATVGRAHNITSKLSYYCSSWQSKTGTFLEAFPKQKQKCLVLCMIWFHLPKTAEYCQFWNMAGLGSIFTTFQSLPSIEVSDVCKHIERCISRQILKRASHLPSNVFTNILIKLNLSLFKI